MHSTTEKPELALPQSLPGRLVEAARTYRVRGARSAIFHQGQPMTQVHVLVAGYLKLSVLLPNGEETILDVLRAPAVCGNLNRGARKHYGYSAMTLSETTVMAVLDFPTLESLSRESPDVLLWLDQHRETRLSSVYGLLAYCRLPLSKRLPVILRRLADVFAGAESAARSSRFAGDSVPLSLSAGELAQFAQTSPESLSRALRSLESSGIVWHDGRRLMVRLNGLEACGRPAGT